MRLRSKTKQEKAAVTPYSTVENIIYTKEVFNISGIELSSPRQIASGGEALFICDTGNSRIIKCGLDGSSAKSIGTQCGFAEPACIAASSTRLCVYDRKDSTIRVMTLEGEPMWEFCLDDKFDFLSEVNSVAITAEGAVYFSLLAYEHTDGSGIYRLKDGQLLKTGEYTVGALCSRDDDIYYMSKYELQDDDTWVTGYAELAKITDEKYERVSAFSNGFSAAGLELSDGRLYAYDSCSQSVNVFSLDGEYMETVFSEPVVNDFSYNGFCGDGRGDFYLCDTNGNTVYRLV